jgi:hypothetical protein
MREPHDGGSGRRFAPFRGPERASPLRAALLAHRQETVRLSDPLWLGKPVDPEEIATMIATFVGAA